MSDIVIFETGDQPVQVRLEGAREVRRQLKHYNLDAIISVGYRVNSSRATRFRQWATGVLRQHLVEGYTLNQQRLKERGIEFEQALDLLSRTLANQIAGWNCHGMNATAPQVTPQVTPQLETALRYWP